MKDDVTLCEGKKATQSEYSKHFRDNFNVDGSPSAVDLEEIYNSPQDHIENIVAYSKYCYRKYGLIMRTVNIMRDFGANGYKLKFSSKATKKEKKLINEYIEQINLKQLLRDMMYELSLTGNLACYDREKRVDIYPINLIEVLPLIVDNKTVLGYKLSLDDNSLDLNSYSDDIKSKINLAYPKEILDAMAKGDELAILDPDSAYFAKINASQYESYGISVILPAFDDLAHKSLLKETERSTANDVIEKVMMIKVGDSECKPTQEIINQYNDLFDGTHGTLRVTVPYYVDAKYVEPETTIFGREKFLEVDTDILNTLGISLSLLRGSDGSNYADGILNFSGLIRTIENVRDPISKIVNNLFKALYRRSGLSEEKAPTIEFEPVVIDKADKIDLVKELFSTAGLPYQILYEEAGYDYDHIKLLREEENNENIQDIFKSRSVISDTSLEEYTNKEMKDLGGAPKKAITQRKSDPKQSNNEQPRTGLKNTYRTPKK